MSAKKKVLTKKETASSPMGNFPLDPPAAPPQGGMRIIAVKTLRDFWTSHADAEQPLKAWYKEASDSRWGGPAEIKRRYPSADILPGNRVVFNIKGNTYRLIVKIHYNTGIIYIRFVGSHAEYDKVDAGTV